MSTADQLVPAVSERPEPRLISIIARKELRDAIRSKWFWLWAGSFGVLAAVLANIALPGSQVAEFGNFGRSAASLVALVQIIIPLMGLTLGAQSLAGQRESGAMRFLLSHPVSRTEAFWGTFAGLAIALLATSAAGFGAAGLVTGLQGGGASAASFVRIAVLTWVLAVSMLGVGMLVSTFTNRAGAALGTAVFVWLALTFLGDIGIMGTSVATDLPVSALFFAALANPVEAFRLASLTAFSGSLDVLGPAGTYAIDRLGDKLDLVLLATTALWAVVPAALASIRFSRSKDL
ncbi:MAG: ABC transporter permease subunit [Acidimicrobiia bacterium]|nr:ABC transporter permease subunit [Acidimicrobiia bacterium]